MTMGEKIDYIWTYYKAQIIIAAFIIVFFISLVHHLLTLNCPSYGTGVFLYCCQYKCKIFPGQRSPIIWKKEESDMEEIRIVAVDFDGTLCADIYPGINFQ